jgi:hypothetical protein
MEKLGNNKAFSGASIFLGCYLEPLFSPDPYIQGGLTFKPTNKNDPNISCNSPFTVISQLLFVPIEVYNSIFEHCSCSFILMLINSLVSHPSTR